MDYSYEYFAKSADYIKERAGDFRPELGLILGSGLAPFMEKLENPISIPYGDIPNFLTSTVASHPGRLIFGTVEGKRVVCMAGRFHSYEGYDFEQLTVPVRVLKLLGVRALILTNAAGAINTAYRPGDVMLIRDHIKLTGDSPMRGKNPEAFGPRFFDVTNMYDKDLRALALACGEGSGLTLHEGVYFFFTGPQFETPAEIRAARILGGDAAGMSTVTEALTAAHCGLPVLGMSLITNMAAGVLPQPLSDEEVVAAAAAVADTFSAYLKKVIGRM